MGDAYYTPVTPGGAVQPRESSFTDEYYVYKIALNKCVVAINQRLRAELLAGPPGTPAAVRVPLAGVTQQILLGLVLAYRGPGWDVSYGRDGDGTPYIDIGIAARVTPPPTEESGDVPA